MPITWEDAATSAGMGLVQGLTNEMFAERNMQRQRSMANYNQQLALDMWNKTNYEAQRHHMERAGLNIGLMYKGAGEGGRTAGAGVGQAAQAETPNMGMGLQLKLQADQTKANTALAAAQADLAKTQAEKLKGVDTDKGKAEIKNINALTDNEVLRKEYLKLQNRVAEVDARIKEITELDAINLIKAEYSKAAEEVAQAKVETDIQEKTKPDVIKQIQLEAVEKAINIKLQKQNIQLAEADTVKARKAVEVMANEIVKMANDTSIDWAHLSNEQQEIIIKNKLADLQEIKTLFDTSSAQKIKQWTSVAKDGLDIAHEVVPGKKVKQIGFK